MNIMLIGSNIIVVIVICLCKNLFSGFQAKRRNKGWLWPWEAQSKWNLLYREEGSLFHVTNVPSTIMAADVEPVRPMKPSRLRYERDPVKRKAETDKDQEMAGSKVVPPVRVRDSSTQTPFLRYPVSLPLVCREFRKMISHPSDRQGLKKDYFPVHKVVTGGQFEECENIKMKLWQSEKSFEADAQILEEREVQVDPDEVVDAVRAGNLKI